MKEGSPVERSRSPSARFWRIAVLAEGGLGIVAVALGWLLGSPPLNAVMHEVAEPGRLVARIGLGGAAAVPLFLGLMAVDGCAWPPLRRLRELVDSQLVPLFRPLTVPQLLALSVAAGLGEEMLFRGWLQASLTSWCGPPLGTLIGLGTASLLFGLCHCLTPTYAVLAALVSLYLGALFLLTGGLTAPVVTHAAYDFLALLYLVRRNPDAASDEPRSHQDG
jgi:hypothetical protein